MSLRRAVRVAGVAGGVGLAAAGVAQPPDVEAGKTQLLGRARVAEPTAPVVVPVGFTVPAVPAVEAPPALPPLVPVVPAIPPAPVPVMPPAAPTTPPAAEKPAAPATPPAAAKPSSGTLTPSPASRSSADALPKMMADARAAYARLRDYACHYVRQERVQGRLVPEEMCELRVRTSPFSVSVRVMGPKEYANRETAYVSTRFNGTRVRFKETNKLAYNTLSLDDPRVLADTRHVATDTGLLAVLDRVDAAVRTEKQAGNPVQVLVSDYTFAGRACTRYEVFADRPHARRYAAKHVIYVDAETKLPVRYEAYDQPTAGGTGELIEAQSFVGMRVNTGLGEQTFTR
jgi:hypothetical protein